MFDEENNVPFMMGTDQSVNFAPKVKKAKKPTLKDDLFGGATEDEYVNKMVDAYEEHIGIKSKQVEKKNLKFKNIMLSPGSSKEDEEFLNILMNNRERFEILQTFTSWTARGDFKIFVLYADDLDVKKKQEEEGKTNEKDS